MANEMSAEDMQRVNEAIFSGQKIQAVKLYREATGGDLKDAKDFVDELTAKLREEHAGKFSASTGKCCSSAALVLLAIGVVVSYLPIKAMSYFT